MYLYNAKYVICICTMLSVPIYNSLYLYNVASSRTGNPNALINNITPSPPQEREGGARSAPNFSSIIKFLFVGVSGFC